MVNGNGDYHHLRYNIVALLVSVLVFLTAMQLFMPRPKIAIQFFLRHL